MQLLSGTCPARFLWSRTVWPSLRRCSGALLGVASALLIVLSPSRAAGVPRYRFPLNASAQIKVDALLLKDLVLLKTHKERCAQLSNPLRNPNCDPDRDLLTNGIERALGTNPQLPDSDFDGRFDATELRRFKTDPLAPDNPLPGCYPLYFDKRGNTIQFGIPPKVVGNGHRGQQAYASSCAGCHGSEVKGAEMTFEAIKLRICQAPMFISTLNDASLADITAYLNKSKLGTGSCLADGAPNPGTGCSSPYFDSGGNTTRFGIPSGLVGNLDRGARYLASNSCTACHAEKGKDLDYPTFVSAFQSAQARGVMRGLSISSQSFADLVANANRSIGGQICSTPLPGTPLPATPGPVQSPAQATPLPAATPRACINEFFDALGNTNAFGIPADLTGNVGRGALLISANRCNSCHIEQGLGADYPGFVARFSAAQALGAMSGIALSRGQFGDLVAYENRDLVPQDCGSPAPAPTATPTGGETPTPTETPPAPVTPTAAPTPLACGNQYFDANRNTLPGQFGIPSGLVGSVDRGGAFVSLACSSCHGEHGAGFTFSQLQTAVTGPKMNITTVTNQQFADVTAFENRNLLPSDCTVPGTPTPTPTPLSDFDQGRLVYEVTCRSCHPVVNGDFRELTSAKLHEALRDVRKMRGIVLTSEQERVLLYFFHHQ